MPPLSLSLTLYDFLISFSEKNKKRDVRSNWYHEPTLAREKVDQRQEEIPTDVERGDIPILHGDCEGRPDTLTPRHLSTTYTIYMVTLPYQSQ